MNCPKTHPTDALRLVPDGSPAPLRDCPPGPFTFNGGVGFKTEYGRIAGKDIGDGKIEWLMTNGPDAYVLDSGEVFWGGCSKAEERDALIVQPLSSAPASPLPEGGGPKENVPVKRKLEAGAALRDRLKATGDALGSQAVSDLVGSLRASHQNSAALFAEMNEAKGLLTEILESDKDWLVLAPDQSVRVSAFLVRNGKGEG